MSRLWVFRDGKEAFCTRNLIRELQQLTEEVSASPPNCETTLDALIRAGELETALADMASPLASTMSRLTDALASKLLEPDRSIEPCIAWNAIGTYELPETLPISPPEGFAYYALHPLDFALAAGHLAHDCARYAVIGIRNIGSTLSAIAAAALRSRGSPANRITVRPTGHPYDRVVRFSQSEVRWLEKQLERSAQFLIVDEGPGLSGSSFLSVGEALVSYRVPGEQITFLGTREPVPDLLRARDAADRWRSFRWRRAAPGHCGHFAGDSFAGCGGWRGLLLDEHSDWPASWTQMERAKFLSSDRKWLWKFEGLGRFGRRIRERALCLNAAGFACDAFEDSGGYVRYPLLRARTLNFNALSQNILDRIAQYCAFRAQEFTISNAPAQQLGEMLSANLNKEFGYSEVFTSNAELLTSHPVVSDGRMQPHEWLLLEDGAIFKTDGTSHGDDHFFPGPTDIAWDLAGAAVEWGMDQDATEYLLSRYRRLTGDDARPRFPAFLLAYAVFRMGYCKMAAEAESGSAEEKRLRRAYRQYRDKVQQLLFGGTQSHLRNVVTN